MKFAVVGCGAVGSYYGAMLSRDGQEVHFLLRSDYEFVRRHGVQIRSPKGDFRAHPKAARSPQEIGSSDVVLIALKTTANSQFATLIPPLVGPNTMVVTMQNGLGNEDDLAKLFPPTQILGALCFVCLNRVEPGTVQHLDHGKIVLGEFSGWPEPRTHDLAGALRHAGVPCSVTENLARAHWEKLVWNVPFNGLGVAGVAGIEAFDAKQAPAVTACGSCLPTDQLLRDTRWERLVKSVMLEVISIANAEGYEVPDSLADLQIERTRTMGSYKASTLIDFERGLPLELEAIFLKPLDRARRLNVLAPVLERLCLILSNLNL
jgi:2-dehydropantoate 2-reductase